MLSGLNKAATRQVQYALSIVSGRDDEDSLLGGDKAARTFLRLLPIIQSLADMGEQEMCETRADLSYWSDLAESVEVAGSVELFVACLHTQCNPWAYIFPPSSPSSSSSSAPSVLGGKTALVLTAEEFIYNVESDFQKQCLFLSRIKEASDCLKKIGSKTSTREEWSQTDSVVLRRDASILLNRALAKIEGALEEFVPRCTSIITTTSTSSTASSSCMLDRCISLERCIISLQQGTQRGSLFRGVDRYPLGIVKMGRRPPEYQSRWLGDFFKVIGSGVLCKQVAKYWRNGVIQDKAHKVLESLNALSSEYAMKAHAMTELLAKAAAKGAAIITESEVMDARANLAAALNKWSETEAGRRSLLEFYSRIKKGSVSEMEAQMGALRHAFEKDISEPFKGIARGTVVTSIFIQGLEMQQKMLEAMLQADAAMSKNQLTMVLTSILPAFVLVATLYYVGKTAIYPLMLAAQDGGHLRQLLSDLEDSLIEVSSHLDAAEDFSSSPRRSSRSLLSPLQREFSSAGASTAAISSYISLNEFPERRLEVARGRLCFDLLRLKRGLDKHYKSRTIFDRLFHVIIEPFSLFNYLPFRLIYRLWSGKSAKRQGSREYNNLLKDLSKLESPDDEIYPNIKLSIIAKLKARPCFRA